MLFNVETRFEPSAESRIIHGACSVEIMEAYLRLVEGIVRIREVARASWFNPNSGDSVVFIEAYAPLEYGGGRGVYRGHGFLGKLLRGNAFRGAFIYLPLLRLSEPISDDEPSILYYSLIAGIVAEVPSELEGFEKIYAELIEGRLVRPLKRSQYLLEPLLSTRLQRLYDAASSIRDCKGSLKVELNGVETAAYTLPAFVKCLVTGRLDNVLRSHELRDIAKGLKVRGISVAEASTTLIVAEKRGLLVLRHPASVLLEEGRGEEAGGIEPAQEVEGGAAAGI